MSWVCGLQAPCMELCICDPHFSALAPFCLLPYCPHAVLTTLPVISDAALRNESLLTLLQYSLA